MTTNGTVHGDWWKRIGTSQFRFYDHDAGIQMMLKNTRSEDGHVYGDLHVYRDYMDGKAPGKMLVRPKVNLTSDRSIPGLVRSLEKAGDKWGAVKGFEWAQLLEEMCAVLVEQMDHKGVVTEFEGPMPFERRAQPMLFRNFIPENLLSGLVAHGGCVDGDTLLDGPDGARPIHALARAGKPVRVWALGESGPVPVWADAPFLKGNARLYEFTLSNHRSITTTGDHRFLTDRGWEYAASLSVGARIAGCEPSPLRTMPEPAHAGLPLSEQRWRGTPVSWQDRCSTCCHLCGRPLPGDSDIGPTAPPSPVGAREHSRGGPDSDDRARSGGRTRTYQSPAPHSRSSSSPVAPFEAALATLLSSSDATRYCDCSPTRRRFRRSSGPAPCVHVSHPTADSTGLALVPLTVLRRVTAVRDMGIRPYYDLHVPGYENYLAHGLWHHNTGKSLTGLLIALAVMTGRKIGPFEPLKQGPVLYADWENDHEIHWRRMTRICDGLGIDFPEKGSFVHYAAKGKLTSAEGELTEIAHEKHTILMITDSIGFSAGGNLNDSDVATSAINVQKHVPGTKIMIAHLSKAAVEGNAQRAPSGNAFFWNGPQAVYDLHAGEPALDGSVRFTIYQNKANVGARLPRPLGIKVFFEGDDVGGPITPEAFEVQGHLEGGEEMSIGQRISDCLLHSSIPLTATQIAEQLYPADPDGKKASVSAMLRQMRHNGRAVSFGEQATRGTKGAEQTWAMAAQTEVRNVRRTSEGSNSEVSEVCSICLSSEIVAYEPADGTPRCRKHKPVGAFD